MAAGVAGDEVSFAAGPALDDPRSIMFLFIIIIPPFIIPPTVGAAGTTSRLKHRQSKRHGDDEIFIRPFAMETANSKQQSSKLNPVIGRDETYLTGGIGVGDVGAGGVAL